MKISKNLHHCQQNQLISGLYLSEYLPICQTAFPLVIIFFSITSYLCGIVAPVTHLTYSTLY